MRIHPASSLLVAAVLACIPAQSARVADGMTWLPVVEIASGGGAKGPWRQNDSHYDYVDDGTAAFLPDGRLAVAWVDQRRKDVFLKVLDADGRPRGAVVNVSRNPATFSWLPRIVAGGPDTLYVLWQEIIFSGGSHGGDVLFAHSTDGGRTFSQPRNLSTSRGGDGKGRLDRDTWSNGSLDLAAGPDGSVYAAWTEYDGMLWLARSRDGGRSFSRPQLIAGDVKLPARGPSLAIGPAGRLYLAWAVGEDHDADIRVSLSSDGGGTFAAPVLVGADQDRADMPRLVVDHKGALHLAYLEQRGNSPARVRYVRADPLGLRFGTPTTQSHDEGAAAVHLACGDDAHPRVLWEPASRKGLWQSATAGAGFSPHGLIPHSVPGGGGRNGSQQGILGQKLALHRDGTVAIVNSSLTPGHGSRVWLMRGRSR
ncbi:sialidase family protein [Telluria aromaticivorans]|uniref:Exo-alpha-sialidase n=1 Tax=Telluria aromaticivorans TaxID=2725995 RepID=A0A7Y2K493_9BURK|nr:sialidase family protein [Telluria aromaticivorans]NNG25129.1 exo-alpha-sialidase [Telluria aromaticivorans]